MQHFCVCLVGFCFFKSASKVSSASAEIMGTGFAIFENDLEVGFAHVRGAVGFED